MLIDININVVFVLYLFLKRPSNGTKLLTLNNLELTTWNDLSNEIKQDNKMF